MVQLGLLYLTGEYGDDKRPAGIGLLERAARLDNVDALRNLAGLHIEGTFVDRDFDAAEGYYLRAAEVDDAAKIDYARFLLQPNYGRSFNDRAYGWVREAAKAKDPHGMLLLAQLFHTGSHVGQSTSRARSWFKRAVRVAPDDPYVVNQAAWTFTVTRMPRLRDARYAQRIMDRVMADEDTEARARIRPTWTLGLRPTLRMATSSARLPSSRRRSSKPNRTAGSAKPCPSCSSTWRPLGPVNALATKRFLKLATSWRGALRTTARKSSGKPGR